MIDATVGTTTANSYCTIAFASEFHQFQRHNRDWFEEYVQEDIAAALITVTRYIDYYEYKGRPVTNNQSLKWPRAGARYNGRVIDHTDVPVHVRYACAQIALDYLRQDIGPRRQQQAASTIDGTIQRIRAGSVEISYGGGGATVSDSGQIAFISPEGFRILRPFFGVNTSSSCPIVRV